MCSFQRRAFWVAHLKKEGAGGEWCERKLDRPSSKRQSLSFRSVIEGVFKRSGRRSGSEKKREFWGKFAKLNKSTRKKRKHTTIAGGQRKNKKLKKHPKG